MSTKSVRKTGGKQNTTTSTKKTLDIQHTSKISEFSRLQDSANDIKTRIRNIDDELENFKEQQMNGYEPSEEEISYTLQLKDEKVALKKELQSLHENDEIEYFVNTAPILFQYYDIVEKGTDDQQVSNIQDNNILKFFISKTPEKPPEATTAQTVDRASLLEKYLWLTDDNYIKNIECELKEKCFHCGATHRNLMLNEGMIHCLKCDAIEYIIIDHDRPSYKDPPKEISYFSYKRINHLNEFFRRYFLSITMLRNSLYTYLISIQRIVCF